MTTLLSIHADHALSDQHLCEMYCRLANLWCVRILIDDSSYQLDEIYQVLPFLDRNDDSNDDHYHAIHAGCVSVMFKGDEAEANAWALFDSLPTDDNPPRDDGKMRVYAQLVSPTQGIISEST